MTLTYSLIAEFLKIPIVNNKIIINSNQHSVNFFKFTFFVWKLYLLIISPAWTTLCSPNQTKYLNVLHEEGS